MMKGIIAPCLRRAHGGNCCLGIDDLTLKGCWYVYRASSENISNLEARKPADELILSLNALIWEAVQIMHVC